MKKPRRPLRKALLSALGLLVASCVVLGWWEGHVAPLEQYRRMLDLRIAENRYQYENREEYLRDGQRRAERLSQLEAQLAECTSEAVAAREARLESSREPAPAVQPVRVTTTSDDADGLPGALAPPCISARAERVRHQGVQAEVTWLLTPKPPPAAAPESGELLGPLPPGAWMHPFLSAEVRTKQEELRQVRAKLPPELVADEQERYRIQPLFHWMEELREANALAAEALALLQEAPALDAELELQRSSFRRDLPSGEALKLLLTFSDWQLAIASDERKAELVARLQAHGFQMQEQQGEGATRLLAVKPRPPLRRKPHEGDSER